MRSSARTVHGAAGALPGPNGAASPDPGAEGYSILVDWDVHPPDPRALVRPVVVAAPAGLALAGWLLGLPAWIALAGGLVLSGALALSLPWICRGLQAVQMRREQRHMTSPAAVAAAQRLQVLVHALLATQAPFAGGRADALHWIDLDARLDITRAGPLSLPRCEVDWSMTASGGVAPEIPDHLVPVIDRLVVTTLGNPLPRLAPVRPDMEVSVTLVPARISRHARLSLAEALAAPVGTGRPVTRSDRP